MVVGAQPQPADDDVERLIGRGRLPGTFDVRRDVLGPRARRAAPRRAGAPDRTIAAAAAGPVRARRARD
ncbi:hypothetical protein BJF79_31795 [Actinomadura sp. CNU-125]|nr:hypothetical protein BJF79_31795 [Actinomadura sp. CNU-125]